MIDLREELSQLTLTYEKKYGLEFKNKLRVFIGLTLIQWGCQLCGINFKEEDND